MILKMQRIYKLVLYHYMWLIIVCQLFYINTDQSQTYLQPTWWVPTFHNLVSNTSAHLDILQIMFLVSKREEMLFWYNFIDESFLNLHARSLKLLMRNCS